MHENNPTKSSFKTLSHSVSTTILLKTNAHTKTPQTSSSTGRNTFRKHNLPSNASNEKFGSLRGSFHNEIQAATVKKQLSRSVILPKASEKTAAKTRNAKKVAFFRCVPKSCFNSLKSNSISHRGSETSTRALKLFSECIPKEKIESLWASSSKLFLLKISPIVSSRKKVMNLLPHDINMHKLKTPEEYLKGAYHPVLKFQKKIHVKHLNAIAKEMAVNYSKDFSLSKKENFLLKYRLYPGVLNLDNDSISKEVLRKMMTKKKKLSFEVNEILRTRTIDNRLSKKQNLLERFKAVMIRAAIHFKRINISLEDFYSRSYDIITPFEVKGCHLLIDAIKRKSIKEIYQLIKENTFLLYDFDNFRQTPLHWVAKRNVFQVISFMVRKGACVDSKDQVGRTPLHIAVQMENIESVQFLLYELASPFVKTRDGLLPIDFTCSYSIKFILQRASLLHTVRQIGKAGDFEKGIKTGLEYLFNDELRTNFSALKADL